MGLERERERKMEGGRGRGRLVRVGDRWTYLAHLPGNDSLHTPLPPPAATCCVTSCHLHPSLPPIHMGYLVHLTWPFGQLDCDLTPLLRQMGAWHRAANLPVWWSVKYAMRTAQSTNLLKLHAANRKTNTPSNCACLCVCVCVPEQPQLTVQSWWVDARRLNSSSRLQIGLLVELKMRSALSS